MIKYLKNNFLSISFCILSLSLFLGTQFTSISIIIILLSFTINIKQANFIKHKYILYLLPIMFLLYFISSFYSTNKQIAYNDIFQKLSLILFPVIFIFNNKLNSKNILLIFIYSASIFSLILLIRVIIIHLQNSSYYMYYKNFAFYMHPSYLSMYFLFSLSITIYFLTNINLSKLTKTLLLISIPIILTGIIFCESKIAYLILIFIVFIFTIYLWKKIKSKIIKAGFITLLILISVFVIKNRRINNMINSFSNVTQVIKNKNTDSSTGMRLQILLISKNIIKQNFLFGVGNGDAKTTLKQEYNRKKYHNLIKHNYNTHNQFLETFIATGIFGFITLLLIFIIPFIKAIKEKNLLLILFLVIVFFNFMFEAMLNRQAGVVFFAFFYTLLVTNKPIENTYQ